MIADDYAHALYKTKAPSVEKLREVLGRRGHEKLLPRIYAAYQKLLLRESRRAARAETEDQEQTRILLELYRRLIQTP